MRTSYDTNADVLLDILKNWLGFSGGARPQNLGAGHLRGKLIFGGGARYNF